MSNNEVGSAERIANEVRDALRSRIGQTFWKRFLSWFFKGNALALKDQLLRSAADYVEFIRSRIGIGGQDQEVNRLQLHLDNCAKTLRDDPLTIESAWDVKSQLRIAALYVSSRHDLRYTLQRAKRDYQQQLNKDGSEDRWTQELDGLLAEWEDSQTASPDLERARAALEQHYVELHQRDRHDRNRAKVRSPLLFWLLVELAIGLAALRSLYLRDFSNELTPEAAAGLVLLAAGIGGVLGQFLRLKSLVERISVMRRHGWVTLCQPLVAATATFAVYFILTSKLITIHEVNGLLADREGLIAVSFLLGFSESAYLKILDRAQAVIVEANPRADS